MLTPQLQQRLDEKWNNCWPVSDLRPLALLDLISYLFFIKKLDDWELIHSKVKSGDLDNFIYTKEVEEFTWSKLQNLSAREIQQLFNKEHGLIELMNKYANRNALFSDFFKAPLLIDPTPKLLFNSIEIINIIETSDKITQGAIVEYLFSKSKMTAQNGHEFLPEYISKLVVSIADPLSSDVVIDPCAGNGSLLINAYRNIFDSHTLIKTSGEDKFNEINVSGFESDLVQLRLAGMNMVLHGIKNPNLRFAPLGNENFSQNPSIIISNLLFATAAGSEENMEGNTKIEKENVLLNEIIERLKTSGRAVVLVPQVFLKSDNPAVIKTRKAIVDNFNLQGVISLSPKSDSLFSNACLLVFEKTNSVTKNIWFCKWGTKKKKTVHEVLSDAGNEKDSFEENEAKEILQKWKNREEREKDPSDNSFFIPVDYIKTNHYKLSFNDYKLIRQQEPAKSEKEDLVVDETGTILAAKKENLHEFFESSVPLPEEKRKRKLAPVLIILLILILGGGAFYWFYLRDNHQHLYTRTKVTDTSLLKVSNSSTEADADTTSQTDDNQNTVEPSPDNSGTTDASSNTEATKYTVVSKAWFHYQPDSTSRKPLFLQPRKDIVLHPKQEKNGFVYVVYVNSKGQATHGWLDKNDLEAVE